MKKLIYAGLACFMLLSVQACSGNAQKSTSDKASQEIVSQTASDPVSVSYTHLTLPTIA